MKEYLVIESTKSLKKRVIKRDIFYLFFYLRSQYVNEKHSTDSY